MIKFKNAIIILFLLTSIGYAQVGIERTGVNNVTSVAKPYDNNSVGLGVLNLVTPTGEKNSGFGFRALFNNTDGQLNTAMGHVSLYSNINGIGNTAVGAEAGKNVGKIILGVDPVPTSFNTFIGFRAGLEMHQGRNNTIIGANVASVYLTGNVIPNVTTINNHVIIGDGTGNPRIFINDKGNMGLGTIAPNTRLEIASGAPGKSGLRFTNLLSTSTPSLANGKALTVDESGNVILAPMVITNDWTSIGNTGTNPSTNFIGTTDLKGLAFRTNSLERFRITETGNIGIGIANPITKLHVSGDGENCAILIQNKNTLGSLQLAHAGGDYFYSNQSKKGDVILRGATQGSLIITNEGAPGGVNDIKFATQNTESTSQVRMMINKAGKVSIGTTNTPAFVGEFNISAYTLFVKGGVLTDELRVRTGWADYVFANNYALKPLEEVEKYISQNNHLPNMPSAKKVENEGVSVGDMLRLQQEKIEELTLYLIQQNKEIQALKELSKDK